MQVTNFLILTGQTKPRIKIYYDAVNYRYFLCDADHWAALTDPVRKVRRISEGMDYKEETDWYDNRATNLSTVQALTYS